MEAIKTENLTKKYKSLTAVDNINLTVNEGELFSLLGVNGAGKTTTIKMLTTLTSPTQGDAVILGKRLSTESAEIKPFIAISPQETAVAPHLTARENLRLICGVYGLDREKSERRISKIITQLKLEPVIDRRASKLSGGWQRRLSIAMALISQPKILFLDEPTLGLDVLARSDTWDIIRSLKGKTTIILTTHYMEEAEALSDRIAIMKDGKILRCDTAEAIKKSVGAKSLEEAFISIVKGVEI